MTEDKRYRKKSWIITAIIQLIVLVIVYFAVAWREPDPPIPEYGIELSFGMEASGADPAVPVEEPAEVIEQVEESVEEPVAEEVPTEEAQVEPAELDPSLETEQIDDPVETEDVSSPDIRESFSEEPEKKMEKDVTEKEDPVKPTQPETKEDENEKVEDTSEKNTETQSVVEEKTTKGNTSKSGDQGDPESKIDERALYGKKGSGDLDGASLQMTGWKWDTRPRPDDRSDETGKIVFQVKIDQDGYIVDVRTITSTVTPAVEQIYRRSIEQLTFSQTSQYQPAPFSTGTITFIIKSK